VLDDLAVGDAEDVHPAETTLRPVGGSPITEARSCRGVPADRECLYRLVNNVVAPSSREA
jgi:hypothetical protein